MKRFMLILTLLVFIAGCGEDLPLHTYRFRPGDKVKITISGKAGMVIDQSYGCYMIRYSDDLGELDTVWTKEYEVQKWEE